MKPRPTIRLRLTAWYAAIFIACGAVLLGLSYVTVREQFKPQVEQRAVPAETPEASEPGVDLAPAERPAAIEQRVLAEEERRDEQALRNVLGWFTAILGVMTVASVGLGWLVAGRALAPVSRITETARRVSGQRLHERIALDGPRDELKELADTFDAMLARLDATFDSHRRFVANASHELRTPLSIIRAELEELADTGPLPAEQEAMVANARRAAARSERLIGSLLTLARSEGGLEQRARVELASIVVHALEAQRATPVQITRALHPVEIAGDPVLLESLVVNLVENGLRYNRPRGQLHVEVRGDGEAELVVSNTGPLFAPEKIERLFDPFARRDRSPSTSDGGFGLGLSIVRAVAAAHRGTVTAAPREGGGLTVTVRLPVASANP